MSANHVPNHQRLDLSRCRSKKASKLRVIGFCEGNSPLTSEFPHTKGQWRGKCFNSMTSSCVYWTSIKMPQSIQSLIHLLAQSDSHSVGHSLTYSVTHPLTCTIFLIESYQPTNKSCLLWVDGRLHVVWYHSSLSSRLLPVSGDANLNDAIPKVFSTKYCLVNAGNSKQINVNKCCIFIYI